MKILLIDDNKTLCETLKGYFKYNGIDCDVAYDGEAGILKAMQGCYEVILLDIALPNKSGTDVLSHLRQENLHIPVLMLTAKADLGYKKTSFEYGADDYLTKPFIHEELLLRVKALARRPHEILFDSYIRVGNIRMTLFDNQIEMNGNAVNVSVKEAKLLEFFIKHKDKYISKEWILNAIWGIDKPIQTNNIEVYVHMLRKTFPQELSGFMIETKKGLGYRLREVSNNV